MKTRGTLSFCCVVVLAFMAAVWAGCEDDGDTSTTASESESGPAPGAELGLIEPRGLTVGTDTPYPPFEQGEPPNYDGFDIDLVNAIAERLGLTTKIVDSSFSTLFADQQAGRFDIVASATTITPARSQRVTFSDPYFHADQSLMVQDGSELQSVDDITSSTRIAVLQGGTGHDYAESETDAEVQAFPAIVPAYNALQAGQVDGVINDFPASAYALKEYPDLDVVQTITTGEQFGFPMQSTNTALIEAVNGALAEVIEDGTYAEIFESWFEEQPPKEFQPPS